VSEQLNPILTLANNNVNVLIALANAIVNVVATTVVTANGAANGALTTGNGYVSGIFGASVMIGGMLRGGNVQSSATLPLTSNLYITNSGILSVGNSSVNSTMNSINITVPTANHVNATVQYFPQANLTFANVSFSDIELTTTGVGQVTLDTFTVGSYRSAEYLIQVKNNAANGYQVSKLLLIHNGTTPISTEYGLLTTNSTLATFTSSGNSTLITLSVTPASVNTTIRALRTVMNV